MRFRWPRPHLRPMIARHRPFFEDVVARGGRIDVYHSGRTRAEESGVAVVGAMIDEMPDLQELVDPGQPSVETVYFNEAEGSEGYEECSDGDVRMLATVAAIEEDPMTRQMARLMLRQRFTGDFVQQLADGAYEFSAAADPDDRIEDELDAAEALFGLYSIAPGPSEEYDGDFGRFIRVVSGDASHPVTLRFSHSQPLVPLAAWPGIEGGHEVAAPEELYPWDNNPWRSELVGPMAANVQWDVVQSPEGTTLVRMLHQEAEVPFVEGCRTWREGSLFYELDEIRRCYDL